MVAENFNQIHSRGNVEIFGNGVILKKITPKDYPIFINLLKDKDYRFFFCLDGKDKSYFENYIYGQLIQMETGMGCAFTINKKGILSSTKVGYIVANYVPVMTPKGKDMALNINFAILPQYRNKGLVTKAIKTLIKPYYKSPINWLILDISEHNHASIRVAQKLNFLQDKGHPLYDSNNPYIGNHYKWMSTISYMMRTNF